MAKIESRKVLRFQSQEYKQLEAALEKGTSFDDGQLTRQEAKALQLDRAAFDAAAGRDGKLVREEALCALGRKPETFDFSADKLFLNFLRGPAATRFLTSKIGFTAQGLRSAISLWNNSPELYKGDYQHHVVFHQATFDKLAVQHGSSKLFTLSRIKEAVYHHPSTIDVRGMTSDAKEVAGVLQRKFPFIQALDGFYPRLMRGSKKTLSDHATGNALDVHMPDLRTPLGMKVVDFLLKHADEYRIKYILWDNRQWCASDNWRKLPFKSKAEGVSARHENHIHISFYD